MLRQIKGLSEPPILQHTTLIKKKKKQLHFRDNISWLITREGKKKLHNIKNLGIVEGGAKGFKKQIWRC